MSKEVKEVKEESFEEVWKKHKKGCFIWIGVIVLCFGLGGIVGYLDDTPKVKIDPCKCIKTSSKKDLGLSYDESYWNKCVDKYYSVDNLFNKCVTKD